MDNNDRNGSRLPMKPENAQMTELMNQTESCPHKKACNSDVQAACIGRNKNKGETDVL
jgi:hypothetical protein